MPPGFSSEQEKDILFNKDKHLSEEDKFDAAELESDLDDSHDAISNEFEENREQKRWANPKLIIDGQEMKWHRFLLNQ